MNSFAKECKDGTAKITIFYYLSVNGKAKKHVISKCTVQFSAILEIHCMRSQENI